MVSIFRQLLELFNNNYSDEVYSRMLTLAAYNAVRDGLFMEKVNREYVIKLYDHKILGDKAFDFSNDANHVINQARSYAENSRNVEVKIGSRTLITKKDLSKSNDILIKMLEQVNTMEKLNLLHEQVCKEADDGQKLWDTASVYKKRVILNKLNKHYQANIKWSSFSNVEKKKIVSLLSNLMTLGDLKSEKLNLLHEQVCKEGTLEKRPVSVYLKKDIKGTYFVNAVIFDRSRANKPYDNEEQEIKKLEKLQNMEYDKLKKIIDYTVKKNNHILNLKKESLDSRMKKAFDNLKEEDAWIVLDANNGRELSTPLNKNKALEIKNRFIKENPGKSYKIVNLKTRKSESIQAIPVKDENEALQLMKDKYSNVKSEPSPMGTRFIVDGKLVGMFNKTKKQLVMNEGVKINKLDTLHESVCKEDTDKFEVWFDYNKAGNWKFKTEDEARNFAKKYKNNKPRIYDLVKDRPIKYVFGRMEAFPESFTKLDRLYESVVLREEWVTIKWQDRLGNKFTDRVPKGAEKDIIKRITLALGKVLKIESVCREDKTYVTDKSDAPKGVTLKKGVRGGMYYDSDGSTTSSNDKPKDKPKDKLKDKPKDTSSKHTDIKSFKKLDVHLNKYFKNRANIGINKDTAKNTLLSIESKGQSLENYDKAAFINDLQNKNIKIKSYKAEKRINYKTKKEEIYMVSVTIDGSDFSENIKQLTKPDKLHESVCKEGWKKDSMWKDGFAWKSETKSILISEAQFEGFDISVWQHSPYKSLVKRNFKTLKQAQTFAQDYMNKNKESLSKLDKLHEQVCNEDFATSLNWKLSVEKPDGTMVYENNKNHLIAVVEPKGSKWRAGFGREPNKFFSIKRDAIKYVFGRMVAFPESFSKLDKLYESVCKVK